MQGDKNLSVAGLREYFGNAVAGKKGKNRAVRRKSDRLLGMVLLTSIIGCNEDSTSADSCPVPDETNYANSYYSFDEA